MNQSNFDGQKIYLDCAFRGTIPYTYSLTNSGGSPARLKAVIRDKSTDCDVSMTIDEKAVAVPSAAPVRLYQNKSAIIRVTVEDKQKSAYKDRIDTFVVDLWDADNRQTKHQSVMYYVRYRPARLSPVLEDGNVRLYQRKPLSQEIPGDRDSAVAEESDASAQRFEAEMSYFPGSPAPVWFRVRNDGEAEARVRIFATKDQDRLRPTFLIGKEGTLTALDENPVSIPRHESIRLLIQLNPANRTAVEQRFVVRIEDREQSAHACFDVSFKVVLTTRVVSPRVIGIDIGTCASVAAQLETWQPDPEMSKNLVKVDKSVLAGGSYAGTDVEVRRQKASALLGIPDQQLDREAAVKYDFLLSSSVLYGSQTLNRELTDYDSMLSSMINLYYPMQPDGKRKDVVRVSFDSRFQEECLFPNLKRFVEAAQPLEKRLGANAQQTIELAIQSVLERLLFYCGYQDGNMEWPKAIVFSIPNVVCGRRRDAYIKAARSFRFQNVKFLREAEASLIAHLYYCKEQEEEENDEKPAERLFHNLAEIFGESAARDTNRPPVILVVDQGAGSLDIAAVAVHGDEQRLSLETLYAESYFCAGDDLDMEIAQFLVRRVVDKTGLQPDRLQSPYKSFDDLFSADPELISKLKERTTNPTLYRFMLTRIALKFFAESVKKAVSQELTWDKVYESGEGAAEFGYRSIPIKYTNEIKGLVGDLLISGMAELIKSHIDKSIDSKELHIALASGSDKTTIDKPITTMGRSLEALKSALVFVKRLKGRPPKILFSGRTSHFPLLEAEYRRAIEEIWDMNPENVIFDLKSMNSGERAKFAKYAVATGAAIYGQAISQTDPGKRFLSVASKRPSLSIGILRPADGHYAPLISRQTDADNLGIFHGECLFLLDSRIEDQLELVFSSSFRLEGKYKSGIDTKLLAARFPIDAMGLPPVRPGETIQDEKLVVRFEIEYDEAGECFRLFRYEYPLPDVLSSYPTDDEANDVLEEHHDYGSRGEANACLRQGGAPPPPWMPIPATRPLPDSLALWPQY